MIISAKKIVENINGYIQINCSLEKIKRCTNKANRKYRINLDRDKGLSIFRIYDEKFHW